MLFLGVGNACFLVSLPVLQNFDTFAKKLHFGIR